MQLSARILGLVAAATCYAILALALAAGSRFGEVPPLVWLPSGVAIAALHLAPSRRWPETLAALFVGHLASMLLIGFTPTASLAFTVANSIEALICGWVGVRLFDRKIGLVNPLASLGSLFVVSVLGASVSTAIAVPFRDEVDALHTAHRLLAHVVGILSVTPILLYLHDRLRPVAEGGPRLHMMVSRPGLPVAVLGLFGLALAVLYLLPGPMLLLLAVALVVVVIRFGQLAASAGVLVYAAAAMVALGGGGSLPAFAGFSSEEGRVILQMVLLLMLMTSLPLSTLLLTYDQLKTQLLHQNAELGESLKVLTMAEELAGIGRWRLDLRTREQHWSPAMLDMNGLDPKGGSDPGNITGLLPDGGTTLFGALSANRDNRGPYTIDYTIVPQSGGEQFLRMVVSNEFDEHGKRIAVFGVAMDVTEQVNRERALQEARQRALELAEQAQKLALTDALTGLANRRAVFDQLAQLARSSPDQGQPLALVMFDIDHFKRVNDTHGHQTGDAVLQRIAELARRQVQGGDLVGRIGGEEFVWLLPDVDAGRARELAERLREDIERESSSGGLPCVTVSIGMALLRRGDTPEQLIARADEALYLAKKNGRNRVQRAA